MATTHFEVPSGLIDGVNTTFFTSEPYVAGTLAPYKNGLLMPPGSWVEENPAISKLSLVDPPQPGDVLQVFFVDTSAEPPVEVSSLTGSISPVGAWTGTIETTEAITGHLTEVA
jgi:hypothetical protein